MLWLKSPKNLTASQTPSHPLSLSLSRRCQWSHQSVCWWSNELEPSPLRSFHFNPSSRGDANDACKMLLRVRPPRGPNEWRSSNSSSHGSRAALQSKSNCRICILKSFICSNEFTCVSAQAGELASYNCSRYVFESVSDLWSVTLLFTQRSLCVLEHIDMFSIFLQSFKDMIYICDTVCDSMWAGAARAA